MHKPIFFIGTLSLLAAYAVGCSDDSDDGDGAAGTAGLGGTAGAAGAAGTAGAAGDGGAAGAAGDGGAAGAAGDGGAAGAAGNGGAGGGDAPDAGLTGELSFFVTSTGSGEDGGNLGGLDGADAKCQDLAEAVGAGDREWRAYLSTSDENAVDRIGEGPWFNADGALIAEDLESLHADEVTGLPREPVNLVLDENGDPVPASEHDILTGSNAAGELLVEDDVEATCENWTSSSPDVPARVGHSDIPIPMFSPSWNSAHTVGGCSQADLVPPQGAGRFYCFAAD